MKEVIIFKNHIRAKTIFTTSNLKTKNIKMSDDIYKMKPSSITKKNIKQIKNTWENNSNYKTPTIETKLLKNIIQLDKMTSMIIMKWTVATKKVNINQYLRINHSSLAICSKIIINLKWIIISPCMKISNSQISIMLWEILKITQINIPIILLKKISIKNRKCLMAKIFTKMNIKMVLPKINKNHNVVSLIIKIKNSNINHNVSYKIFKF